MPLEFNLFFYIILKRILEINLDFYRESVFFYKEFYISGLKSYYFLVVDLNITSQTQIPCLLIPFSVH